MTIKEQLYQLEKRFNKKFADFTKEIRAELTPLRDFMVGQQAIKDSQNADPKTINVSKEAWNIIKWLVLIVGAILGVKLV